MMKDTKNGNAEQSEMGLSLEELIRRGARELIQKAIEVELRELLGDYENVKMLGGQRAVVRNGYRASSDNAYEELRFAQHLPRPGVQARSGSREVMAPHPRG